MDHYHNILHKLEVFGRKYYTKTLLKGALLFLVSGAVFAFALIALEYWLWLDSTGRLVLFLVGIAVLLYLFIWQIGLPLAYLVKLKKGLTPKQASKIIGRHFPEVGDKLYNLLDLAEQKDKTELLLASITQRSRNLHAIPFRNAVNLKETLKYLRYLAVPALIVVLIWATGNLNGFAGSYERLLHYDLAFEPPAPFSFVLLNEETELLENQNYQIQVTTRGSAQPGDVFMVLEGKSLLLRKNQGIYEYTLSPPLKDLSFYFEGGGVISRTYHLKSLNVPEIQGFDMSLEYPEYLGLAPEIITGTGNAIIPEGTRITWRIQAKHTNVINWKSRDSSEQFVRAGENFSLSKEMFKKTEYQISTGNLNVSSFEELNYKLDVVRDAYPKIRVQASRDSLNPNIVYYSGLLEDDYGLSELELVWYPKDREKEKKNLPLHELHAPYYRFYYTFPDKLIISPNQVYEYYFQVRDNDGLRGGKISKSQTFSTRILDQVAVQDRLLWNQQQLIENLDQSVEGFNEQQKELKKITQTQKEKNNLNFNDQRQVSEFLQNQKEQEQMMQRFTRKLKENLEQERRDEGLNELLKERLERQEIEARKNEKLLDELNRIADKLDKEELAKRLEQIAKKQQNNKRSLEQLLELTKRYYVSERTAELANRLQKLGKKQEMEGLKEREENKEEQQEELNRGFKEIQRDLDTLLKDNERLRKPLKLIRNSEKERGIRESQQQLLDSLRKKNVSENDKNMPSGASEERIRDRQRNTGKRIQEMGEQLEQSGRSSSGNEAVAEDAEMLRQILDNLVTFSFKQEALYEQLHDADAELGRFSEMVRGQQELKQLFEHVDDSLFALSLRRAELSEVVNEEITEVYYNIDKTLESVAENRIYRGVSYQQYVLNASNKLGDMLADILENMQQSLAPGSGSGQGMQLQDIIISQEELQKRMQGMGTSAEDKEGQSGKSRGSGKKGDGSEQDGSKGKTKSQINEGNSEAPSGRAAGQGMTESQLKELYEIYKQQEEIRNQLERQLQDMISNEDRELANRILRQMQEFQEDLLENGVTNETKDRLNRISYQLLKLKNAALKQGRNTKRVGKTNVREYTNPLRNKNTTNEVKNAQIEVLERQNLPLRQNYKKRVQRYFGRND